MKSRTKNEAVLMNQYEIPRELKVFFEKLSTPFAVCQSTGKGVETLAVSDGFCELFGYTDRSVAYSELNRNMFKNVHPEDTARIANEILRFSSGETDRLKVLYRSKKTDAQGYRVIRLTGEHSYTNNGMRIALLWFSDEGDSPENNDQILNVNPNKAFQEVSINDVTRYDYLTGLPNLSYFFELAEVGRKIILNQGGKPALLYIDLNGMKHFNHKYGFAEGDKMLKSFAKLLSITFQSVHCCHAGADRFAAVADENNLEDTLNHLFEKWKTLGEGKYLPLSVGIYPYRIGDVPIGMAYDRAKIACDAVKGIYSSSFSYFNEKLNERFENRQFILDNFELALSEHWIQVYYQPIMRAASGKVCDEEALARWIDPDKGFLSPAEFIPYLEDAGLIYKLDLYMLDRILEHIRIKEKEGFYIVPHSVNLSRSDFDACDMVEEIRRRVDEAGVSRDRISIEITESIIGSDFEFMKAQIERFQALGFPVWMDDFGSGYSSLDVLHSIKFDLIKFDMGFMQRLDENEDGRIILTELMKMALALGIDTICEGVETEDQVRFLQEIGCSRLQGYFFSKPKPFLDAIKYHRMHKQEGYENPEESAYYELVGSVNLYDVGVITSDEKSSLKNTYNTLPMCIIEVRGDSTRFVRANQSYRDFFMRFFGLDLSKLGPEFVKYNDSFMENVVRNCCEQGVRTFYDEKMTDGSVVHSFARRIGINAVTGTTAIAIAVLSIREPNEKLMIEQILSVIESFGESMPGGFFIYRADESKKLIYANKAVCDIFGCESLEEFKDLTGFTFRGMVHPDDYERISESIENQVKESKADLDFVEYRIVRKDGSVRWIDDYGHFIEYDDENSLYYVFISDITDKYEQAQSDKAMHHAVMEALTKAYDSVWLITDFEHETFELFRIDQHMEHLIPANAAVGIETFSQALAFYSKLVLEEDRQRFLYDVSAENIARNTENKLVYSVPFRRVFEDGIRYYRVEFTKLDLPNEKDCIVAGFKNVDEEIRKERMIQNSLNQRKAIIDILGRSYDSVWVINDMESQSFELFRVDKKSEHLAPSQEAAKFQRFTDGFVYYSKLLPEEDRKSFLESVTPENILKNTENEKTYSVLFRRVFEDGIRYYLAEFSRLDLESGETNIIAGFRNVDEEIRRFEANRDG